MIPAAVFALSFSTLLYELALARWLAIAHWGHLQTLVIAIALFGSAVSGAWMMRTTTAGAPGSDPRIGNTPQAAQRGDCAFPVLCFLCFPVLLGSFFLAHRIPLDYLRLPFDRLQLLWLLCAYLCLALPFFLAGLATCLAYVRAPQQSGWTAFAAMGGSGAGAAAAAFLIPLVGEGITVAIAALVLLAPAMVASFDRRPEGGRAAGIRMGVTGLLAAAALVLLAGRESRPFETRPSPYKSLSQLLMMPGTEIVARSESVWGSARVMESPSIRFAPGLSLAFAGRLPRQTAVIVDGDETTAISDLSTPGNGEYAKATQVFSAHIIAGTPADRRSCLIIQRGGGLAVVAAIAAGAERIALVTDSPEAARRAREAYRPRKVSAEVDNPRSYLAASRESYDLIHVENWGPSVPGMASLSINALLTTDAFRAYWKHLGTGGVLAISRKLIIPPSDSLRIFASLLEALRYEGVQRPEEHLAVVRNWDSCTFLASRAPLDTGTVRRFRDWCAGLGFDLDWFPGIVRADTNRFNVLEDTWFYDSYAALIEDSGYAARYFLDITPQSDDRPFPSRFVRWSRFGEFLRATGGRTYTLLLSGEIVAAAVLLETVLLAAVVLLVPLMLRVRSVFRPGIGGSPPARPSPESVGRPPPGVVLLFLSMGFGYIFAEIALLDTLIVILASPLIAFAVVLGGMLVFSGLGGLMVGRLPGRALLHVLLSASVVLALAALGLAPVERVLFPLPLTERVVCSLLLLAIPSVVLGIPFALAIREVPFPQWRAFAWAANGSASVVAAGAAALIAMGQGIQILAFAAAAAYLVAMFAASVLHDNERVDTRAALLRPLAARLRNERRKGAVREPRS